MGEAKHATTNQIDVMAAVKSVNITTRDTVSIKSILSIARANKDMVIMEGINISKGALITMGEAIMGLMVILIIANMVVDEGFLPLVEIIDTKEVSMGIMAISGASIMHRQHRILLCQDNTDLVSLC